MDHLCFLCFVFLMLSRMYIATHVVTCLERDDLLALVDDVYCIFVTFPCVILDQMWYLIVPFSDLCHLSYFVLFLVGIIDPVKLNG